MGLEGPRKVVLDVLESHGDNIAFGIQEQGMYMERIPETMEYYFKEFARRKRKGRILMKEGDRVRYTLHGKTFAPKDFGEEFRYLPAEYFSPLVLEVYGHTLAIIDWTEPITTIIIEKKEIAQGFLKYFDGLWNIAKP
jgi:hypothetical protein